MIVTIKILNQIGSYIVSKDCFIKSRYYIGKRNRHSVCKLICSHIFNHYFYQVSRHGITDVNYHLKNELSKDSYLFQYGYSTNKLEM